MAGQETDNAQNTDKSVHQHTISNATHLDYYTKGLMLGALSPLERRIMLAFRFSVMAGKRNQDVVSALRTRTGSLETAVQLSRMVKRLAERWEGPFMISPPCCQRMTPDEKLVADMLRSAMANDRAAFNQTLHPMFTRQEITDFWWVTRATGFAALQSVL
ncbi:hypothetical protein [Alterisphingorhabdus coralli]|uniref:Uncharacterized protein n=1 Tax=Alterisphingorhabdus coralli TaxID=3071408 RepID=A0AA97I344_9SPHN|nr:hypothetical protein [Parasphingorhabdus sp. SCSIO 66989]WOE76385.1 hypothetical protein RB602_06635 [Parasphingorhabdus sp. SCSIO 66989]